MVDGWFNCVLYDVIIKCIFLVVMENYMNLLLIECNLILIFDCFWVKLVF